MVRKATHFGGSSLEYKAIKPTDWLSELGPRYRDDEKILNIQAQAIELQGRQEIARGAQQDKLFEAIGSLIPKAIESSQKAAAKRKADFSNLLNQQAYTPDIIDTAKEAYKLQKEGLLREHIELGKLAGWEDLGPVLSDKILNGTAAEQVILRETFAAQELLFNGNYDTFLNNKVKGKYLSDLNQIPPGPDRDAALAAEYKKYLLERLEPFAPSDGVYSAVLVKEINRLVTTRNSKATSKATAQITEHNKAGLNQAMATLGLLDDGNLATNAYQVYLSKYTSKFSDIPGGRTAHQQGQEALLKDLVTILESGTLTNASQLANKLITSAINHPAGKTLDQAYFDKGGVIYNMLTNAAAKGDAIAWDVHKGQIEKNMQRDLLNISGMQGPEARIALDKFLLDYGGQPGKNKELYNTAQSMAGSKFTVKELEAKTALYDGYVDSGFLFKEDAKEIINNEPNPYIKSKYEKIRNEGLKVMAGQNIEDHDKGIAHKIIQNANEKTFQRSSKLTDNGRKVRIKMQQFGDEWKAQRLKSLLQPDGTYASDPNFGKDYKEALDAFWEANGGGGKGRDCVGIFCLSSGFNGDYKNITEFEEAVQTIDRAHKAKFTDTNRAIWRKKVTDNNKKYLKTEDNPKGLYESKEKIAENVAEAYLSGEDIVGVIRNKTYSDEILAKAALLGMTPGKLVELQLKALVNDDDFDDFAKLHGLDKMTDLKPDLQMDLAEAFEGNQDVTYLLKYVGFGDLSPKQQARILDEASLIAKERYETIKADVDKQTELNKNLAIAEEKRAKRQADQAATNAQNEKLNIGKTLQQLQQFYPDLTQSDLEWDEQNREWKIRIKAN